MADIVVHIEAQVNPTEDIEKVKEAVTNVFGTLTFNVKTKTWGHLLTSDAKGHENLIKLFNLLSKERIVAAARKVFLRGLDDNSVTFYLNKQVAYAGHISFCQQTAESPLGPIKVQIRCNDPRKLIDWLAPRTTRRKSYSRKR
jgi:predicted RNA binding protein with dsRBD fold (UPF0201 family)